MGTGELEKIKAFFWIRGPLIYFGLLEMITR